MKLLELTVRDKHAKEQPNKALIITIAGALSSESGPVDSGRVVQIKKLGIREGEMEQVEWPDKFDKCIRDRAVFYVGLVFSCQSGNTRLNASIPTLRTPL